MKCEKIMKNKRKRCIISKAASFFILFIHILMKTASGMINIIMEENSRSLIEKRSVNRAKAINQYMRFTFFCD
jgi:hypothetical protein